MWILILLSIFFITSFWIKSGQTPYNLTMVVGKKGSGKTCFLVHEIKKYYKKGWTIYTDFDINIPHIRIIDPKLLGTYYPVEHSLICLDEVGITFNNRNFKSNFTQEQLEFWKLQRHAHCKIIIASQSWDIDLKLRSLTDKLFIQTSIGNKISISKPVYRVLDVASEEAQNKEGSGIIDILKKGSIFTWKFYYMPRYFKYFDSFSKPEKPEIPYREVPDPSLNFSDLDNVQTDLETKPVIVVNVVNNDPPRGSGEGSPVRRIMKS